MATNDIANGNSVVNSLLVLRKLLVFIPSPLLFFFFFFEIILPISICIVDVIVEEDEVEYEELPQPHVIETGDSVKVKQVLDDTLMAAVIEAGYEANYSWDNFKLFLMVLSCVCAMLAQFYPMPFPQSRILLAICCGGYFVISSILQAIVIFIDNDTIMFTKPKKVSRKTVIPTLLKYSSQHSFSILNVTIRVPLSVKCKSAPIFLDSRSSTLL